MTARVLAFLAGRGVVSGLAPSSNSDRSNKAVPWDADLRAEAPVLAAACRSTAPFAAMAVLLNP